MISYGVSKLISDFLESRINVFTVDELYNYIKSYTKSVNKKELKDILNSTNFVFPLVKNEFITRAGVFTNLFFSFMPTQEEIKKNHILIGHRCMPFINPEQNPDSIIVLADEKIVPPEATSFSMNLAMDTFALYGEGYEIPLIFNDKANDKIPLSSVQYSFPKEIKLTSWRLDKIAGNKDFQFGDRILCRVVDWNKSIVEMMVLKDKSSKYIISSDALEREEWYSYFEEGLLKSFNKNGPCSSIEEQLAFLFLEERENLCVVNCGSSEEFLKHTKKIGFSPFGVESRIWFNGESVPYVGEWNKASSKDLILSDMSIAYSPILIDSYIKNSIYNNERGENHQSIEELSRTIFPYSLELSNSEWNFILQNISKRYDELKEQYNDFFEVSVALVRQRLLDLYSQVNELVCSIGCSNLNVEVFPQQELVILMQIFTHSIRLIEEFENLYMSSRFPIEDIKLSLDGMEDTFYEIRDTLKSSIEYNIYKGFEVVGGFKNGK